MNLPGQSTSLAYMSEDLQQQLASYGRAVVIANETYPRMSRDERAVRARAAADLKEHAPSDHGAAPTCSGCDGAPWPCAIVRGAIVYANPAYN